MKIVSHRLTTFSEAGKYTCATAEYTGLVSYSCVKRGGNTVIRISRPVTSAISRPFVFVKDGAGKVFDKTTSGLRAVGRAGKYGCATAEYTGVVSYSYVKRGGNAVARATMHVASAISRPFVFVRDGAGKVFGKRTTDAEVVRRLEQKILQIDERLSLMEKRGVVSAVRPILPEKEGRLDAGRKDVLRAIVEENIQLRRGRK
ncbi:MAG: hypothetical protein HWN68_14110 [Desulfobacterales bacterium]|nr:hypothetical protein [Desulfobacterales bacterium]